ncbi:UDP-N-acetylmuramoyl-L-alanine--D-glutamate ligase [Tissierella praeacuta]|uniref:UDP-N-acetylmuramoyl-L-alanine--D-glutamate ligase n=1 Tax=Tissierella praeacuta TaxID=43131 RepID=UPI00333EB514
MFGLGISGLSTVKALHKLGAQIVVSDSKTKEELKDFFDKIKDIYVEKYLNTNDIPLENIDLIVKSPGILPTAPILLKAQERNIEVITDIELAYRISPTDNIIAITGTNGKTTTTTLVGEIFKKANYNTYVAGNIGVGILWDVVNADKDDVFVIEASSFQLENTIYFKPKVSLITNITPDHLNWHGSLDKYIIAKKKVFKNQDKNDYTVLNYDDETIREMEDELGSNIIWFSANQKLDNGVFIEGDYIVIKHGKDFIKLLPYKELKILGKHNLENALGAVAIAWVMGIDLEIIKEVLKEFPGVEHRIEYVKTINEISFYNDSKGTNSDSTIKAIEALNSPIILIAGGYDKGAEFDELILAFDGKVKELILLGATKEKIKETALKHGFNNIHLVESMKEAVALSYDLGREKDNILLSPACASWGMYNNFEERGQDFKDAVYGLKEE